MLGDEGAKLIGEGIRNNRSVVHFDISNNELSSRGGEQIIRGLADNESITSITLGSMEALHRNRLGPSCMLSMANMLKNNRVITFINLSSTSIRNEGVLNLSLGIIANPSILALNLSQNEISYEKASADAIVDMLTMSRIRDFDLSENPLGNQVLYIYIYIYIDDGVDFSCIQNEQLHTFKARTFELLVGISLSPRSFQEPASKCFNQKPTTR